MKAHIVLALLLILNSGCFLKRNADTEEGIEAPPPATDIIDVATGRPVYIPPDLDFENNIPDEVKVCDVETVELSKGPYELFANPFPVWATKDYDHVGTDEVVEGAEHIHIRSAYASTASGSPIGSFLSSGYADANGVGPVVWTPDVGRDDYTIHMLVDGSVDLVPLLDEDGNLKLSGEARVRYPTMKTYITAKATFDIWRNCTYE
jgi:hypothetical protein